MQVDSSERHAGTFTPETGQRREARTMEEQDWATEGLSERSQHPDTGGIPCLGQGQAEAEHRQGSGLHGHSELENG